MDQETVDKLYKKYNVTKDKILHMRQVAKLSLIIAEMVNLKVDKQLLAAAALLHDLGTAYYRGGDYKDDFDSYWGHHLKTRDFLIKEGYSKIADVASKHNSFGLTVAESKKWGYKKGVSLVPDSDEARILAFADGFRKEFIKKKDCTKVQSKDSASLFKKYGMLKAAEERKKKLFNYLVKHKMDYEALLKLITS
ncbi:MAG: HD domain-containing protein [Nanoarchaeota archaeon]|nr:HD domain-containing protein [Nanoarchaeota archaeon]